MLLETACLIWVLGNCTLWISRPLPPPPQPAIHRDTIPPSATPYPCRRGEVRRDCLL